LDGNADVTSSQLLELDIDTRVISLWEQVYRRSELGEFSLDFIGSLMRAAYGRGYTDSLRETVPGKLCSDHGYPVPQPPDQDPTVAL